MKALLLIPILISTQPLLGMLCGNETSARAVLLRDEGMAQIYRAARAGLGSATENQLKVAAAWANHVTDKFPESEVRLIVKQLHAETEARLPASPNRLELRRAFWNALALGNAMHAYNDILLEQGVTPLLWSCIVWQLLLATGERAMPEERRWVSDPRLGREYVIPLGGSEVMVVGKYLLTPGASSSSGLSAFQARHPRMPIQRSLETIPRLVPTFAPETALYRVKIAIP